MCLAKNAESQDAVTGKIVAERQAGKWYSDSARRESVGWRLASVPIRARPVALDRLRCSFWKGSVTHESTSGASLMGRTAGGMGSSSRSATGNRSKAWFADRSVREVQARHD
jgi:hypothetical protein